MSKKLKLALACGQRKPEGFQGVDIAPAKGVDYVVNLLEFPWTQFKDNSVDEIEISHFVEHIPHGDGFHDPFFQFFDEVYRILKPAKFSAKNPNIPLSGFAVVTSPYYSSMRCWQDPTHQRAISEATFLYLNENWRKENMLDHYPVKCDFDFQYAYNVDNEWLQRSQDSQGFAFKHYNNSIADISVTLIKAERTA